MKMRVDGDEQLGVEEVVEMGCTGLVSTSGNLRSMEISAYRKAIPYPKEQDEQNLYK